MRNNRKEEAARLTAQAGLTLLELMVVIVILGLLAAIVFPKLMGQSEKAKQTAARVQIRSLEQSLQLFKLDNGFYPATEQGLGALAKAPETGRIPKNYRKGGYIDRIPNDPWGNAYVYLSPGSHGDYDISSYGADGTPGGDGENADINSWDAQ